MMDVSNVNNLMVVLVIWLFGLVFFFDGVCLVGQVGEVVVSVSV